MNIYLTFEKEKKLREHAQATGKTISQLLLEFVNSLDSSKVDILDTPASQEEVQPISSPNKISEKGWCQGHFERGTTYELKEAKLEDSNGNDLWVKKLCDKCIQKTLGQVKREGGVLYVEGARLEA